MAWKRDTALIIVLAVFAIITLSEGQKCRRRTFFNGTDCEKCQTDCKPGEYLNKQIKRARDKVHGLLECYPCVPCPEGKYRTADDNKLSCLLCVQNCTLFNRLDDIPCGHDHPGKCGDCLPGFQRETMEEGDACEESVTLALTSDATTENTTVPLLRVNVTDSEGPTRHAGARDPGDKEQMASRDPAPIIVAVTVFFVILAVVLGLWRNRDSLRRLFFKTPQAGETKGNSTDSELFDSGIALQERPRNPSAKRPSSLTTSAENQQLLSDSGITVGDLSTDGPTELVRGEQPDILNMEQLEGDRPENIRTPHTPQSPRSADQFPSYVFEKGDKFTTYCLDHLADEVYEREEEFFSYLGMHKKDYVPHLTLWKEQHCSHKTYVHDSLVKWLEKQTKPNLKKLCYALDLASFFEVSNGLVQKFNEISGSQSKTLTTTVAVVETGRGQDGPTSVSPDTVWVPMDDSMTSPNDAVTCS